MARSDSIIINLSGQSSDIAFSVLPDAKSRSALANDLGIIAIKKLRFEGALTPDGESDWKLEAELGATVVQTCVVTLKPVTTRIDTSVIRRFVASMPAIDEATEIEMPEDDSLEPLGDQVDVMRILSEALALELPDFPRVAGVEPVEVSVTEPGKTPMSDADAKPFAALAGLKKTIEDKDKGED